MAAYWCHTGAGLKFLGNKFDENNLKGILLYSMKIDRLSRTQIAIVYPMLASVARNRSCLANHHAVEEPLEDASNGASSTYPPAVYTLHCIMSQTNPPLIGSVFERKPVSSPYSTPRLSSSVKTGFPAVQHRSQSAFARGRDELRKNGPGRTRDVPGVSVTENVGSRPPKRDQDDWRTQISIENEHKVDSMTEEEREKNRMEIVEHLGGGVGDLLKRVQEARFRRDEMGRAAVATLTPKGSMDAQDHESADRSVDEGLYRPPSEILNV